MSNLPLNLRTWTELFLCRRRLWLWSCKVSFTYGGTASRKTTTDDEGALELSAFHRVTGPALPPCRQIAAERIALKTFNTRHNQSWTLRWDVRWRNIVYLAYERTHHHAQLRVRVSKLVQTDENFYQ